MKNWPDTLMVTAACLIISSVIIMLLMNVHKALSELDSTTPAIQTESGGLVRQTAVMEPGFANQEKP